MRQLITAAMLCTFGACTCGPSPCVTGGGVGPGGTGGFGGAGGSGSDVEPGSVGVSTQVDVQTIETFSSCNGQTVTVTGVEAEVLDPTDSQVASTVSMPLEQSGNVSVTVTFTPATPGPYHITVRFLPSSVTVQTDVLIAVDKSMEMAHTSALSPDVMNLGCIDVDLDEGAAETVLCLTSANVLYSMQNGQTIGAPWPATAFALAEGKVWALTSLDNTLHVLGLGSDGSLTELASSVLPDANGTRVLASGDSALVLTSNGFVQAHYAAGGGVSVSNIVGVSSPQFAQWVPDVGAQIYGFNDPEVCSFSFAGGVTTPLNLDAGTCGLGDPTSVDVIGFDDDGLWSLDMTNTSVPDQVTLDVTGWQAGQARASTGSLVYDTPNAPSPSPLDTGQRQATPILYLGGTPGSPKHLYLPHFDGNDVTLTQYPFVDPSSAHADSKRLWNISNNTLTWWPR